VNIARSRQTGVQLSTEVFRVISLRSALATLPIFALAACEPTPGSPADADTGTGSPAAALEASPEAMGLARRFLIVDTHIDMPYRLHLEPEDVTRPAGGDFDYPRAVAGGLDAAFMAIFVPARSEDAGEARALAHTLIDAVEALIGDNPDKFAPAGCAADLLRAKERGLIALPLGMENGGPLEGSFEALDEFRERGIRYITLAHSKSNHISDSSYDTDERWEGLSPFGQALIPVMNERGVMVDVSHISDAAFWQTLELTRTPVIASHSSLRHFTPGWQRNLDDDMVKALGRNGGVVQISFGSMFLTAAAVRYTDARTAALDALRAEPGITEDDPRIVDFAADYRSRNPYPFADLEDVLDHIDRAVALAGIDHVGIGSHYDGVDDTLPNGLKDVSTYPNLVAGLLRHGYDEEAIEKILGGNLMRVWQAVEAHAAAAGYPPVCRLQPGSPHA
jgi:membrane dipeptidase